MVMTLMPMGARSLAIGRVIPTIPPLEAEYAAWPTCSKNQHIKKRLNRDTTYFQMILWIVNDLSIEGCHTSGVNDASSVSVRIRLVLPHCARSEANHIKGSCYVHLQNINKLSGDLLSPLLQ